MNKSHQCALVQQHLTAFITGSLVPIQAKLIKGHLQDCSSCHEVFQSSLTSRIFHAQVDLRIHTKKNDMQKQWLENSFEPEPYYVEALVYEGQWPYANNDYY